MLCFTTSYFKFSYFCVKCEMEREKGKHNKAEEKWGKNVEKMLQS